MNEEERVSLFLKLTEFDAESFHEREIGLYLEGLLKDLGVRLSKNTTDPAFLEAHPDSFANIHGILPGNGTNGSILFCAHMDTVAPGKGKRARVRGGRIVSDGTTVLGADNLSAVVSILSALSEIREKQLSHPDIEILICAAEEPFCEGSRFLDFSKLQSKFGYVMDLDGQVGQAAQAAPTLSSFILRVKGKAAHAGFSPEQGINALNITAEALYRLHTGHVDAETTVNFGTISGGTGRNIVPETVELTGEVRGMSDARVQEELQNIQDVFEDSAHRAGGRIEFSTTRHFKAYAVQNGSRAVTHFQKCAQLEGLEPALVKTFGGSDANRLNECGIETIVPACPMANPHTTAEYADIEQLNRCAALTLRLMTEPVDG